MQKLWNLPKAQAEAWVAALRSGQYKRGSGWLHTLSGTYSVLGVYCIANGIPIEGNKYTSLTADSSRTEDLYIPNLPECLDVSTSYANKTSSLEEVLSSLNDNTGYISEDVAELDIIYLMRSGQANVSFDLLADFIECHVNFV